VAVKHDNEIAVITNNQWLN